MFCNKCGAPNPDNSVFCSKCGYAFPKTEEVVQQTAVQPEPQPIQQVEIQPQPVEPQVAVQPEPVSQPVPTPAPKKSKKGLVIGIVAGVVVLIGIIVALILIIPNLGGSSAGGDQKEETSMPEKWLGEWQVSADILDYGTDHEEYMKYNGFTFEFKEDGVVIIDGEEKEYTLSDNIIDIEGYDVYKIEEKGEELYLVEYNDGEYGGKAYVLTKQGAEDTSSTSSGGTSAPQNNNSQTTADSLLVGEWYQIGRIKGYNTADEEIEYYSNVDLFVFNEDGTMQRGNNTWNFVIEGDYITIKATGSNVNSNEFVYKIVKNGDLIYMLSENTDIATVYSKTTSAEIVSGGTSTSGSTTPAVSGNTASSSVPSSGAPADIVQFVMDAYMTASFETASSYCTGTALSDMQKRAGWSIEDKNDHVNEYSGCTYSIYDMSVGGSSAFAGIEFERYGTVSKTSMKLENINGQWKVTEFYMR